MLLTAMVFSLAMTEGPEVKPAHASYEPRLAYLTGLKCSACHVNRTGGGARTDYGAVFGQNDLPMRTGEGYPFRNRAINDWLMMGTDLRVVGTSALSSATPQTTLETEKANLYLEARLVPDVLTLYVDESFGPGRAFSREVFGLITNLPMNGHAKVGKFFLPFGTRVVDDAEFIRSVTGFDMFSPDQGIEFGIEPGPMSVQVAVSNGEAGGPEVNSTKQVTGSAAWVARRGRLGASGSWNREGTDTINWLGGFGGFNAGQLTVIGEVDRIRRTDAAGMAVNQMLAFAEGNVLIRKGINAKATYGFHDLDTALPNTERTRIRLGVELFPIPFLQVFGYVTVLDEVPMTAVQPDRASVELHFFF